MIDKPTRASRIQISLGVVIQAAAAYFYAETGDLSEAGVFLHTKNPFSIGTQLHLVLGKPPSLRKIDVDGVVRWHRNGQGVGIEFERVAPEDRAAIKTFLSSLPKQSS